MEAHVSIWPGGKSLLNSSSQELVPCGQGEGAWGGAVIEQALGRPLLLKELVFSGDEGQGYFK